MSDNEKTTRDEWFFVAGPRIEIIVPLWLRTWDLMIHNHTKKPLGQSGFQ